MRCNLKRTEPTISPYYCRFLVHWGAELDPMIMTDVVVSVGFSIDYAAHFCYLYYRIRDEMTRKGLPPSDIGMASYFYYIISYLSALMN